MKNAIAVMCFLVLAASFPTQFAARASENTPQTNSAATPYPDDAVGVLILSSDWMELPAAMPEARMKRALATALTYGAVPANIVARFDGQHAEVQVASHRPLICVCRAISPPAPPLLVRLHARKNYRELDGGRVPVPGAKTGKAKSTDLISVSISQPEQDVWLVRPLKELPAGEYALMFGTQNMNVFPFTISDSSTVSTVSSR